MSTTFEMFQMFTPLPEFWWYVKEDGVVVDGWDSDFTYDAETDRMVGSRAFKTEADALAFFADEYPDAVDLHTYKKEG
jgi:hypothetical protein